MKMLRLFLLIGGAAAAYFVTARLLRVEEMNDFLALVKRKAGR